MEIIAALRWARLKRLVGRASKLGLVAVGLGGMAIAGGGGQSILVATPSPTPVVTARPTPSPTPEPTASPVPTAPSSISDAEVSEAQQRLNELGYSAGPVDGKQGGRTLHATMAFQKVQGLGRDGKIGPATLQALRTASRPAPRYGGGRHVEIDLAKQVLYYVDGGSVQKILSISSGSGESFTSQGWTRRAVTPRGRFKVTRKISGWRISPLGKLYYPSYIVGGIAVHGAPSVPAYPASHGCIRVPMWAAQELFNQMPVGTLVIVHTDGSVPQESDVASPPGKDTPDASEPTTPDAPEPTPHPTPQPTPHPTQEPPKTPKPPRTPEPVTTPAPTPTPSEGGAPSPTP